MSERLEEFRKILDFIDDSADMEEYHRFVDTLKNLYPDGEPDWIYRYAKKKAERVEELEQQNKRYREYLGRLQRATNRYPAEDMAYVVNKITREALEDESK